MFEGDFLPVGGEFVEKEVFLQLGVRKETGIRVTLLRFWRDLEVQLLLSDGSLFGSGRSFFDLCSRQSRFLLIN